MASAAAVSRAEGGTADPIKAVSVISTGTIEISPRHSPSRWTSWVAGSLVLLPTPGHTAGSMSLLIRRRQRSPLLLVGDLTYGVELLLRGQVPGVGTRKHLVETTAKVLALKETMPDLVILPAHDPTAAQRLLAS
jgi:glyoxylase-like metal-dependent hydrolase (beta-lactamase superfamily II)